jgi:hypothetical protein
MSTTEKTLTSRRKADRAEMSRQVAGLAAEYGLTAEQVTSTGMNSVDLAGPHGLRLTVRFYGSSTRGGPDPDTFCLSWYGVEEGARLHPGMFGNVNKYHGSKATDVAVGFAQLLRILRERFAVIRSGTAFITDVRDPGRVLARFTQSQLLPGYGQASGLRCFMFTTAAVYAPGRLAAEAYADAHDLRGPQARAYHAELSS